MRTILTLCLALFLGQSVFAQATSSTIDAVKVFRQNAEITRKTTIPLKPGQQEIVLTDISLYILPASLQVKVGSSKVTLLSAKYERNYMLPQKKNPKVEKLQEQLTDLQAQLEWIDDQKAMLKGMEAILAKNQDLGGTQSGFTAAQVIELATSYRTKFLEIRKELVKLKKEEKKLVELKIQVKNQIKELNGSQNQASGNIVLTLSAKNNVTTNLECSYIVSQAGWAPLYDLRSKGITKDIVLKYKANVYQATGQDWKQVKLAFSTGNPTQNNNRPILSPLYVDFYQPLADINVAGARARKKVYYAKSNMMMEESEIVSDGYAYNATLQTNQLSVEFELPGRYDVGTDGKENLFALESYNLETEYVYHAVPKLQSAAFLLAKIKNWGQYNLESGEANIYFEGAFVGKTMINSQVSSEKLMVSMGRDNSIVVNRKPITEKTSKKFIDSKKTETFTYDIIIKNKKGVGIKMEVLDQIPVSRNDKIIVKLKEKGSATYSEESGKLLWEFQVGPGQTHKERFVYTVKYPKGSQVVGTK